MRGPSLILPSASMPWGRWVEDALNQTSNQIQSQANDANSIGSQFSARIDTMQQQIAGVKNVATIRTIEIPTFTRSQSSSSTMYVALESPSITFNPPRLDRNYRVSIIADIRASGGNSLSFARTGLRIVEKYWQNWNYNLVVGGTPPSETVLSIMGTYDKDVMGPIDAQFALKVPPGTGSTVTFSGCKMTALFFGSL